MNKWYKSNQGLVWFATIIASFIAYAYTTFATVSYVDKKHEGVMDVLKEIRTDVREVRQNQLRSK